MRRRWLSIIVVMFMSAACVRSAPPTEPVDGPLDATSTDTDAVPPPDDRPPLRNTAWHLVDAVVGGQRLPLDGIDAVLRFDGYGAFSATACNFQLGEVEVRPTELTLLPHLTSAMACSDGSMDVDDTISSLGGRPTSWSVTGEVLTLTGAATLTYVRSSIDPTAGRIVIPTPGH